MSAKAKVPLHIHRKIVASARRGAVLLDKQAPGWFKRVRTTRLDMRNRCQCVFGQLAAENLLAEFGGVADEYQVGYYLPLETEDWVDSEWDALREEWLREIRARRVAARGAQDAERPSTAKKGGG